MDPAEVARSPANRASRETAQGFCGMIGRSPAMRAVFDRIERFARSPIPVLILGESGTGKELAARAIWSLSCDRAPFTPLNCGAIPKSLLESELFGHARGAFTGAGHRHTGLLGQADGGMLFLDEVAELDQAAQVKLLRAIETGEYRPVGAERLERSNFRVVAATNRDLDALVAHGEFRIDLFHRIAAARITLPPLRERPEDIPLLAERFLLPTQDGNAYRRPLRLAYGTVTLLQQAHWLGNVRQLRNVIESAAALAGNGTIEPSHVMEFMPLDARDSDVEVDGGSSLAAAIREAEDRAIRRALADANGNREAAARRLGISSRTLYRKLTALNGSSTQQG